MKRQWFWMSGLLVGCVQKAVDDGNQRCNYDDVICTIAGKEGAGYNHQNQDALDTKLDDPNALAMDSSGRLLINDSRNFLIRRLEGDGILTTIVGRKEKTYATLGHSLDSALNVVVDMAIGPDGNLYMVESQGQQVIMVDMVYEELSIVAGSPGEPEPGFNEGDVSAENVSFSGLSGIAVSGNGTIYLSDAGENVNLVRAITSDGMVMTLAGEDENHFPIFDEANPNRLLQPQKIGLHDGQLYVADTGRHRIVTVDVATGALTNVAGQTDAPGYQGDGGTLNSISLDSPYAFAFGPDGRMLIADSGNDAIRGVLMNGTVDTVVGRGAGGFGGDEGPAEEASLDTPRDIMYAPDGSLMIADSYNARIRRVNEPGW
jgi:sugar lactone lactonase YvrE